MLVPAGIITVAKHARLLAQGMSQAVSGTMATSIFLRAKLRTCAMLICTNINSSYDQGSYHLQNGFNELRSHKVIRFFCSLCCCYRKATCPNMQIDMANFRSRYPWYGRCNCRRVILSSCLLVGEDLVICACSTSNAIID